MADPNNPPSDPDADKIAEKILASLKEALSGKLREVLGYLKEEKRFPWWVERLGRAAGFVVKTAGGAAVIGGFISLVVGDIQRDYNNRMLAFEEAKSDQARQDEYLSMYIESHDDYFERESIVRFILFRGDDEKPLLGEKHPLVLWAQDEEERLTESVVVERSRREKLLKDAQVLLNTINTIRLELAEERLVVSSRRSSKELKTTVQQRIRENEHLMEVNCKDLERERVKITTQKNEQEARLGIRPFDEVAEKKIDDQMLLCAKFLASR